MNKQTTIWIIAGVVLLFIAALSFTSTNFVGKVAEGLFSNIPQEPLNLEEQESVSFVIPNSIEDESVTKQIIIRFQQNIEPQELDLVLSSFSNQYFQYQIREQKGLLAKSGDIVDIHFDKFDSTADLQLELVANRIQVSNLNFQSPDVATITFYNQQGEPYSQLIHLEPEEELLGLINASSSSTPTLSVNVGTLEVQEFEQSILADFAYSAPQESMAVPLEIKANVNGQETSKRYMIAIGNVLYALQDQGVPTMQLTKDDDQNTILGVTFRATHDIQPFAIPCRVDQDLDSIFADSNVKRIYTYDTQGEQVDVWNDGPAPNDQEQLDLFTGYYVALKNEEETTINMQCTPVLVYSLDEVDVNDPLPHFIHRSKVLHPGWNLISLAGTVARPLEDFIDTQATVAFCQTQGEGQCQIIENQILTPGKAYWVNVNQRTQMGYIVVE